MLKAKRLLFAFLFFLAIVPVSCEKEINEEEIYESDNEAIKTRLDLSEVELRNIAPSNDFAFSFFKDLYKSDTDILISPLGFQMTLAMLGNGVEDEKTISDVIGFDGGIKETNTYFKHLIASLSSEVFSKELSLGNALMIDSRAAKYPEPFLDELKSSYSLDYIEIEAKSLLEQPQGKRPEDIWCQEKTGGLLNKAPFPVEEYQSSLLNFFLFKGEWQDKFDKALTKTSSFYTSPEEFVHTPFMNKQGQIKFYGCDDYRAVSLPFGDGTFTLSIILPKVSFNVSGVLDKLDSESWDKMRNGLKKKEVKLSLPVFSTSYSKRFNMDYVFKKGIPPLNLLGQDALFFMNEDGASAAAVTQASIPISPGPSGAQGIEYFIAESPFIYTISEQGSGLILFIGTYSGADKEGTES